MLCCPRCRSTGPFREGFGIAACVECGVVFDPQPVRKARRRARRVVTRDQKNWELEMARSMRALRVQGT